jgi:hypothetical protein
MPRSAPPRADARPGPVEWYVLLPPFYARPPVLAGTHYTCGKPFSAPPGGRVRLVRPLYCPGRPPWPNASSVLTRSIRSSRNCRIPSSRRCPRAPGPTPCTVSRSASRPIPRWSGCRWAAGRLRSCSRRWPARNAPAEYSSRPGSRARRPRWPPGWPTGRRCTGTSSESAWCTRCARPARPPCSSARWQPGPADGRVTDDCCPPPGSRSPASGLTWAVTWRCGSARARATPTRSATCPDSAGMTCATSTGCPTGGWSGASSATCLCWCTGPGRR